jgi:hypothetical protein
VGVRKGGKEIMERKEKKAEESRKEGTKRTNEG